MLSHHEGISRDPARTWKAHTGLLQADSAAIDAGDAAHCPSTDQRSIARPQGMACDIGAVEAAAVDLDRIFANGFD